MSYTILYRESVKRDLRRMDHAIVRRIDKAILQLAGNARPAGCVKLTGADSWRIRVGDYRIIYEIRDQQLIILIISVAHRREAYRGL